MLRNYKAFKTIPSILRINGSMYKQFNRDILTTSCLTNSDVLVFLNVEMVCF